MIRDGSRCTFAYLLVSIQTFGQSSMHVPIPSRKINPKCLMTAFYRNVQIYSLILHFMPLCRLKLYLPWPTTKYSKITYLKLSLSLSVQSRLCWTRRVAFSWIILLVTWTSSTYVFLYDFVEFQPSHGNIAVANRFDSI